MSEFNPYTAPAADLGAPPPAGGYYVEGKYLYCFDGAVLPARCIKTDEPLGADRMKRKTLYYASPWWILLIFVNLLVLLIVYLCVRKPVRVTYGYSRAARKQRTLQLLVFWLLFVAMFVTMIGGFVNERPEIGVLGVVGLLVSLIFLALLGNILQVSGRQPMGEYKIRGCGKAFLASIEAEALSSSQSPPPPPPPLMG